MTRTELGRRIAAAPRILAPSRFRIAVRSTEFGLIALGAVVGALAGVVVTGMSLAAQAMHVLFFNLPDNVRLSAFPDIPINVRLFVPICGGAVLGLMLLAIARWWKAPIVDPVEANALYGGRMSLGGSVLVAIQNVLSNGFGASVGLEAGYTQISAAIASKIGLSFEMRRSDLRTLVGCGAAAAIATAFNAPLTGAFYAFELIIGTYAIATLAPVVVAAIVGALVARSLVGNAFLIDLGDPALVVNADYVPALILGILCAGFGILIMQGVTWVEQLARKSVVPLAARPMIGGAIVGLLALVSPQVLSAGHGALHLNLDTTTPVMTLVVILLLKSVASAVSIGAGFRGGLFFASLFLGALLGKIFAVVAPHIFHTATLTPVIYAVVGMSSLAVAVIGGPLTMTFLALELTGDFPITVLVLVAVVASSVTVRKTFGYSFATWRFHLRGESIRSAHDVGWIRTLTVGRLMRRDVPTARDSMTIAVFRRQYPLGSTQRVIVTNDADRYAGIVLVPEAHASGLDADASNTRIDALIRYKSDVLLPQMNAKEAAATFDKTESEALAVVDDPKTLKVLGILTESHTLRRYSEELDRRRREAYGEV